MFLHGDSVYLGLTAQIMFPHKYITTRYLYTRVRQCTTQHHESRMGGTSANAIIVVSAVNWLCFMSCRDNPRII